MARIELFFILRTYHWGASGRCQGFLRLLLDTPRNLACDSCKTPCVVLSWQESFCGPVVIGGTLCLCFYVTLNVWVCESPLSTLCLCVCAQSCPTLCHPMDCSLPCSFCTWHSSGKNTGLACISLFKRSFRPRDRTRISCSSCIGRQFFTTVPSGKPPQFSCSIVPDSLRPHESQHARPPCVHHQLPEFTQTHVHRVSDAIQASHPLSSPSPPAPNPSQHQSFPMSQLFA